MQRPALSAFLILAAVSRLASAADIPRPEHPRPDAVRARWANLNGKWEFRFDPKDEGLKAGWEKPGATGFDRSITVPFPWESELSGIKELNGPKVGWYRRSIEIPADFPANERVFLRFEAVDWRADVWVDGKKVAEHEGGYSPFSADITDVVTRGKPSTLVVRAFDPTDPELPTGKQVGWYTPSSGIWQTVWLESRPKVHLGDFTLTTDLKSVNVKTVLNEVKPGKYKLSAQCPDGKFNAETVVDVPDSAGAVTLRLKGDVVEPKLWTTEAPHLYDLVLKLTAPDGSVDEVKTYFGLRTIARGKYGDEPYERILLNGKPVYLRLALDQSFNPQGIYTAPHDDYFKRDMFLAKYHGLNGLRIHIKPDEPRRLFWADCYGLLIFEDMPNTWRQTPKARAAWEATMREVVARDKNHPSIITWVAFNETWGLGTPEEYKQDKNTQNWVKRMVGAIRELDPSRLVEDNSPCNYDHVSGTDINSWHFYIDDYRAAKSHIEDVVKRTEPGSSFNYCPGETQSTVPLINSEYGAVSAGGGDRDVSWGFRDLTTQLRKQPKIQGYVYTELTDIEWEHNGFNDYDRGIKEFGYGAFIPDMRPNELNGDDFVGFDCPPVIVGKPGETVTIPVFISHYSERNFSPTLRYWVDGVDDNGDISFVVQPKSVPAKWTPYGVTKQDAIQVRLPNHPFSGSLNLTLRDPMNRRFAANFVNLVVKEQSFRVEVSADDPQDVYLRFAATDYSRAKWSGPITSREGKVSGQGKGYFEYRIQVPAGIVKAGVETVFIRSELGAKAGKDQVDWPSRLNAQDYPQTDARKAPTTFEIAVNGHPGERDELDDDPADAEGVLSHLAGIDHGSHGYLVEQLYKLTDDDRKSLAAGKPLVIRFSVPENAEHPGGLSIYGANAGRYPFDPVIHLRTSKPLGQDLGVDPDAPVTIDRASSRMKRLLVSGDIRGRGVIPSVWGFTTEQPPANWNSPSFDDNAWSKASGGFGTYATPGITVKTIWNTPNIWLRGKVEVPRLAAADEVRLHLFHDEDVEIWVNGKLLLRRGGYTTAYADVLLTPEQKALFVEGPNSVAVHCRQTRGGQGIDLGLTVQSNE